MPTFVITTETNRANKICPSVSLDVTLLEQQPCACDHQHWQDLPKADRTADGVILRVENSWVTANPIRFVPYANFLTGCNRPRTFFRASIAGGIRRYASINFATDSIDGLATLDASGNNTAGGSIGMNLLRSDLDEYLLREASY